eukprot:15108786-Alexandrium_andersonii.AAC.1
MHVARALARTHARAVRSAHNTQTVRRHRPLAAAPPWHWHLIDIATRPCGPTRGCLPTESA